MSLPPRRASLPARLLLRLLVPRARREDVEGDLLELSGTRQGGRLIRDLFSVFAMLLAARLRSLRPRGLARDTSLAWRSVRRRPGFSLAVIATLALGIGAN